MYAKMTCVGCPCCRKNEYSEIVVSGDMELYMEDEYLKSKRQIESV